ncbi:MAG: 50S ribosomal protein L37ae [Thermoplasmata archaeon]
MGKKKKVGSTGRFGARYGVKARRSIKTIEDQLKDTYECPECHHKKIKRKSKGIWSCRKCGLTFAGGAYRPYIGRNIHSEEE